MKYFLTIMLIGALPFNLLARDSSAFRFLEGVISIIFFIAFATAIYISPKRQK